MTIDDRSSSLLFQPLQLGTLPELQHRVVMAPLTRMRGSPSTTIPGTWVANALMAEHYNQRATKGGLIVSEAVPVSRQASGAPGVAGLYTDEQVEAWKQVTAAVHAKEGIIVAQLWHQGRGADEAATGFPAICPSAVKQRVNMGGQAFGELDQPAVPTAMTEDDIKRVIGEYCQAAKNAIAAGFDGIEVHGANGYLPDQFLQSNINIRTDSYGGSIEGRNKFTIELLEGLCDAIGNGKVAHRLSPYGYFQDARGEQRTEQWTALCEALKPMNLCYVHFMEPRYDEIMSEQEKMGDLKEAVSLAPFRAALGGVSGTKVIVAGGYDSDNCWDIIPSGGTDAIAFGRFFTSNPDLPHRILNNLPFIKYNRPRFYGPFPDDNAIGYTDFPTYENKEASAKFEYAKSGWQLSSDGVQLGGGLFKP